MTIMVTIQEAKTTLPELLARVLAGDEIIISEQGTPMARLTPFVLTSDQRIPGTAAGKLIIEPDFDDPLPPEILQAFEGLVG